MESRSSCSFAGSPRPVGYTRQSSSAHGGLLQVPSTTQTPRIRSTCHLICQKCPACNMKGRPCIVWKTICDGFGTPNGLSIPILPYLPSNSGSIVRAFLVEWRFPAVVRSAYAQRLHFQHSQFLAHLKRIRKLMARPLPQYPR